ncbi:MAG: hypothetical protein ABJD11_02765 [Gemmatimonadota bacterium]
MKPTILPLLAITLVAACGRGDNTRTASADSLGRDLSRVQSDSTAQGLNDVPRTTSSGARTPTPVAVAPRLVGPGTRVQATIRDSLSSRVNRAGDGFKATVSEDVKDANGRVAIPAGSTIDLSVTDIGAAHSKSATAGKLVIRVNSIRVRGHDYPVTATVDSLSRQFKGHGIGVGEVAKVGGGTAAGAILGRVIGGNTKGAIIGGVVGAAAGTAVAVETAGRDVIVPAGTPMTITLQDTLSIARR